MSTKAKFENLKNAESVLNPEDLDTFYDTLEPISIEEILGEWTGGELKTGHPIVAALEGIGWYGKTFISQLDVQPLICLSKDGTLFSDTESMNGEASIWPVEYRGKVSTALVYDGVPILAHFRKVDEDTLIGIRDGKDARDQNGNLFYFFLERI
ncbi:DUF4334 domain-containing protein [Pedobacter sp. MC2016-15]|uniref:DUF4334 domain-containing protein n=1 Tax=Pedobacter sp. MC2016-15 TaxID=2994473 RepID=UPI002246EF77|nr:DUF4334 domain-containing protein [Pedobacter sp. MC2016-15]MCX2478876.1 DUF4334 domain-containing protein [Pedobacter sp. MC2016-15]